MKGFFQTFKLFFIIPYFVSCQKEIGDDIVNNNDIHQSEGTYLVKYIAFDTSYISGLDTINVNQYYYDTQKRLYRVTDKWYQRGATNIIETYEEVRYYSASDTLPYMVIDKATANGVVFLDTLFLNYNSEGLISKDSLVRYENGSIKEMYAFAYNKIGNWDYFVSGIAYDFTNSFPIPTNRIRLSKTIINGNVASSYDSIYGQPSVNDYTVYKMNYVYDNNPNPFQRIALRYPDTRYDVENGWFNNYTKNNPVSYRMERYGSFQTGIDIKQVSIEYTYNSSGYPITIKANQSGVPYLPPNTVSYFFYSYL